MCAAKNLLTCDHIVFCGEPAYPGYTYTRAKHVYDMTDGITGARGVDDVEMADCCCSDCSTCIGGIPLR